MCSSCVLKRSLAQKQSILEQTSGVQFISVSTLAIHSKVSYAKGFPISIIHFSATASLDSVHDFQMTGMEWSSKFMEKKEKGKNQMHNPCLFYHSTNPPTSGVSGL